MPGSVTLEQVETLVVQLPTKDQLRLLAHISERLSGTLPVVPAVESPHEHSVRDERLQLATILCAEVEDIANDARGEFDAADDIHRMREERLTQLCRNDV
jgi:hypothetical protein